MIKNYYGKAFSFLLFFLTVSIIIFSSAAVYGKGVSFKPVINIGADSTSLCQGNCTTLRWSSKSVAWPVCNIDPGIGYVWCSGTSKKVCPKNTTTYTLTTYAPTIVWTSGSYSFKFYAIATKSVTVKVLKSPAAGSVNFIAVPERICEGDYSQLRWNSPDWSLTEATYCISPGGPCPASPAGSWSVYPAATTTYQMTATNKCGSSSKTDTVTIVAKPAVTMTATDTKCCGWDLLWSSTNATSCSMDNGIGPVDCNGNMTVTPTTTTTYTITAANKCGTASQSVKISPAPTVTISADKETTISGDCNTLRWSSTDATSCSIDNGIGTVDCNGSMTVSPTTTATYTITATGDGGTVNASATINVKQYIINTVAGSGISGFSGDNGPAINARMGQLYGMAVDASGNLYIADPFNNRVRKVDTEGIITTVAGKGTEGFSGDNGPASSANLNWSWDVGVDSSNNIYIADTGNHRIRKVDMNTGIITTVAGNGTSGFSGEGVPATSASLSSPGGIAVHDDALNKVYYIADTSNYRIRKVDMTTGIITTVAGNGTAGFSGESGPATDAQIDQPLGVSLNTLHNLIYIGDKDTNRIRKVDMNTGIIETVAGNGTAGFSGDNGPALNARLNFPRNAVSDDSGNLYIADSLNHRIRKVNTCGVITTIAGNGTAGFSGDSGPALNAKIFRPVDVIIGDSVIYIVDNANCSIRKLMLE